MTNLDAERELFLVGSIALADAPEVFTTVGDALGHAVRRIPDGETGDRLGWLEWLRPYLAAHPMLEPVPSAGDWRNATAPDAWKHTTWYRLKPGADPNGLVFRDIGYADHARRSFRDFQAAQKEGHVPPHCRFMVAIPSPFNLINQYIAPESRPAVEPRWEEGILAEVDAIAAAIPHDRLAIQWDCAHDMQAYDDARDAWFEPKQAGIVDRLVRLGDHVPADVELGYHLCYGSFGGKHFVEPKDMGAMVRLANALCAGVARPIDWIHMPVPAERDDDAYFAPLDGLVLQPATRLYLGLIHDSDGEAGTLRRIEVARRHAADFGIATECGFGRRPPETIAELLGLHARLADGR
jgi:hypothetical protein